MFETRCFDIADARGLATDDEGRARVEEIAATMHMGATVIEPGSGTIAGFGVLFFVPCAFGCPHDNRRAGHWWAAAWLAPALRRHPITAFRLAARGLAAAEGAGIARILAVLDTREPRAAPWLGCLGFHLDPATADRPAAERIWVWQTP